MVAQSAPVTHLPAGLTVLLTVSRAALALALPVSTYLLLSPVVDFVVAVGIIRWGAGYARRAIRTAATSS